MKIISLNIWHGTQRNELYDYLMSHIADTDVFCLQEASGELADEVISRVFGNEQFRSVDASKITDDGIQYNLRTYVRPGIDLLSQTTVMPEPDKAGVGLKTNLEIDGQRLSIINVHGAPYPGHKMDTAGRIEQSETIIEAAKSTDGPQLICGDFNLLPHTESVGMFAANGYQNLIESHAIKTTRNRLAWERFTAGAKQLFADYAFASTDLRVTSFLVPHNEASDHLPLEIIVDLGQ